MRLKVIDTVEIQDLHHCVTESTPRGVWRAFHKDDNLFVFDQAVNMFLRTRVTGISGWDKATKR